MVTRGKVALVAVHLGPYFTLAPLEAEFGPEQVIFLAEGPADETRRRAGLVSWNLDRIRRTSGTIEGFLKTQSVLAIIRGTSDGLPTGNLEEIASVAGRQCNIPVFAVEDFPGNYRMCQEGRLDALFVEDEALRDVYGARQVPHESIVCVRNPRYDGLLAVDREGVRAETRRRLGLGERPTILWAGQPDEAHSYEAFARLLPSLAVDNVALLFRAHARECRYRKGGYTALLADLGWHRDVTGEFSTVELCCAADLVVTQFSSVGVEAGYLGTPTLYILFDDLGKAYLQEHKGYDIVPWVANGSAFVAESTPQLKGILKVALFDKNARKQALDTFDRLYGKRPAGAHAVASTIRRILGKAVERKGDAHGQ